jgi:tetratricopeptide (TPR) repeat protein
MANGGCGGAMIVLAIARNEHWTECCESARPLFPRPSNITLAKLTANIEQAKPLVRLCYFAWAAVPGRGFMKFHYLVAALSFPLALSMAAPAFAGDKILYGPAPKWAEELDVQAILAEKPKSNNFFVAYDKQTKLEKGEAQEYVELAMRAQSAEFLAQIGKVLRGYWQPDRGSLTIHRLEILRDGKVINALENGTKFEVIRQEEGLNDQMINGVLTAVAQIEGLRVGDVVRYSLTTTATNAALQGRAEAALGMPEADLETDFDRSRLLWPSSETLNYKLYGEKITNTLSEKDGYSILTLPGIAPKQPEKPEDAPDRFKSSTGVLASQFANWQDVSKVAVQLYQPQGLIKPGSELAAEIGKIRKASNDPMVQTADTLRFVQDKVRYLYNGLGFGNYNPQTPDETWQLRYGDCKAKTLLLLAMLHELGIEAQPVLVNLTAQDAVSIMLPGFQAFDHILVRAKVDGKTLWLDGTGSGSRLADLTDVPPHRFGLPLSAAGAELEELGITKPGRPFQDVTLRYDVSSALSLPAFFDMEIRMRDEDSANLIAAQTQTSPVAFRKALEEVAAKYVIESIFTDAKFSYDDAAGEGRIIAKGLSYLDWSRKNGKIEHKIWSTLDSKDIDADRKRKEWRTIPLDLGDGWHYREKVQFTLPQVAAPFMMEGAPTLNDSVGGFAIERNATLAGSTVNFAEEYYQKQWELPASEIATESRKLARLQKDALKLIAPADFPDEWVEMKAALKGARMADYKKAFDTVVAGAASLEEEKDLPYRQRAYFYDLIGEPLLAEKDLAKAIELEPSAETLQWRAELLLGSNEKAAIAVLQEATELDPEAMGPVNLLVETHALAKRDKAATDAIEAAYKAGLGDDDTEVLRAYNDLIGGRTDASIQRLDALVDDKPDEPFYQGLRCWYKGLSKADLEGALEDCTKAIERSENPANELDSRGLVHMQMGNLDLALADYNASLELDPRSAASYYQRSIVHARAGRAAESANDLAAARHYNRNVERIFLRFGLKP